MPYNPSINPIAPQLTAQGFNSLGNDLQAGMVGYQQNKMMANQAIGKFEGALQSNPDIAQYLTSDKASQMSPELASAFSKLQKGGNVPVQQAALLAQFADTYTQGKAQQQEQQAKQLQIQAMQRQAAEFTQRKAEEDAMKVKLDQINRGIGKGVYPAAQQDNPALKYAAQLGSVALCNFKHPQSVGQDAGRRKRYRGLGSHEDRGTGSR